MVNKPLISVIVVCYRNLDNIWKTLRSILDQDYPALELLVADDCSSDFAGYEEKIKGFINDNKKENLVHCLVYSNRENLGTVKNTNLAFKKSSGAYVKTISPGDSFATSSAITDYWNFCTSNNALVVFAKLQPVAQDGELKIDKSRWSEDYRELNKLTPDQVFAKLCQHNFLPGCAEFLNKQVFIQYGYIPEVVKLVEDLPYWLVLSHGGVKFFFLDKVLINYEISGGTGSKTYSDEILNDLIVIGKEFVYPYDKRYGRLQGIYNQLKLSGLNYLKQENNIANAGLLQKCLLRIRYFPFFVYIQVRKRSVA